MAGIFGVVSSGNCLQDLFLGTFYLQHRAQDYCGLFWYSDDRIMGTTHKGLFADNFSRESLSRDSSTQGIGSVSVTREPISGLSNKSSGIFTFDGHLFNGPNLRDKLLEEGAAFSGYHFPSEIPDCEIIAKIVLSESSFEAGFAKLIELIQGDFALIVLAKEGIYAARGFGRKPLILGSKSLVGGGKSYAVSSESISFVNTGFEIERDVSPGECVLLDREGIHSISRIDLGNRVKYGTFEWIYTAYPTSVIDGRSVAEVRMKIGRLLAKNYPVEADIVSPIPNSGRWHALGYSQESKIPYTEAFIRYDYSGRSFTPSIGEVRQQIADTKLLPLKSIINGKKIVIVDDSIVRGVQTKNQTAKLRENGAREVHGRIACPPLMCACKYGKSTQKDEDCIAKVMSIGDIRKSRGFDSLSYATVEMLEEAIGIPKEKLCLHCWGYNT